MQLCNLAVLAKARRKVVANGLSQLGEHDRAFRTLFFSEPCHVTCGPTHAVAITSHPSAFQDPMIHCLDIGEAGSGIWTVECQFDKVYLYRRSAQVLSSFLYHTLGGMMV